MLAHPPEISTSIVPKQLLEKTKLVRFALIGAGAIARQAYLPAFARLSNIRLEAVVDNNLQTLVSLSKNYQIAYFGDDIGESLKHFDAVIVAVPNYLHFPISKKCLEAGKHVLCEKPITISSEECTELIYLANKYSLKLAVAHTRRFYKAATRIKQAILTEELGKIKYFNLEEGTVFSWPTVSGFYFDKKRAGGGVLMDIGVHVLDLLSWWFPYGIDHLEYQDDNLGGVEAFARIKLRLSNGIKGNVTLSRLSVLNNVYSLQFERGNIEWNPLIPKRLYINYTSKISKKIIKIKEESPVDDLLLDFIDAIQNDRRPLTSAYDGLKVMQLIERCYRSRELLPLEWLKTKENSSW
jgi:predicted dehydrogenase